MVTTCPHCGAITETAIFSTRFRQEIYDFIRKHPDCTMEQIVNHAYRNDRTGGAATNSIMVTIGKMRKQLEPLGLNIKTHTGPGATYRLVQLEVT